MLLFVSLIGYRSKYYRINIKYTSVFKFCYIVIYLRCLLCFGADTKNNVGVDIFSTKAHISGYRNQSVVVCIIYQAPSSGELNGFRLS